MERMTRSGRSKFGILLGAITLFVVFWVVLSVLLLTPAPRQTSVSNKSSVSMDLSPQFYKFPSVQGLFNTITMNIRSDAPMILKNQSLNGSRLGYDLDSIEMETRFDAKTTTVDLGRLYSETGVKQSLTIRNKLDKPVTLELNYTVFIPSHTIIINGTERTFAPGESANLSLSSGSIRMQSNSVEFIQPLPKIRFVTTSGREGALDFSDFSSVINAAYVRSTEQGMHITVYGTFALSSHESVTFDPALTRILPVHSYDIQNITGMTFPSSVEIDDIDDDGFKDLILSVRSTVFNGSVCVIKKYTNRLFSNHLSSIATLEGAQVARCLRFNDIDFPRGTAIGDIDDDGYKEIVSTAFPSSLFIYDVTADQRIELPLNYSYIGRPYVFDVDDDGADDVLFLSYVDKEFRLVVFYGPFDRETMSFPRVRETGLGMSGDILLPAIVRTDRYLVVSNPSQSLIVVMNRSDLSTVFTVSNKEIDLFGSSIQVLNASEETLLVGSDDGVFELDLLNNRTECLLSGHDGYGRSALYAKGMLIVGTPPDTIYVYSGDLTSKNITLIKTLHSSSFDIGEPYSMVYDSETGILGIVGYGLTSAGGGIPPEGRIVFYALEPGYVTSDWPMHQDDVYHTGMSDTYKTVVGPYPLVKVWNISLSLPFGSGLPNQISFPQYISYLSGSDHLVVPSVRYGVTVVNASDGSIVWYSYNPDLGLMYRCYSEDDRPNTVPVQLSDNAVYLGMLNSGNPEHEVFGFASDITFDSHPLIAMASASSRELKSFSLPVSDGTSLYTVLGSDETPCFVERLTLSGHGLTKRRFDLDSSIVTSVTGNMIIYNHTLFIPSESYLTGYSLPLTGLGLRALLTPSVVIDIPDSSEVAVVGGSGYVYIFGRKTMKGLYVEKADPESGEVYWRYTFSDPSSGKTTVKTPALYGDILVLPVYDRLMAVNVSSSPDDPSFVLWTSLILGETDEVDVSAPVIGSNGIGYVTYVYDNAPGSEAMGVIPFNVSDGTVYYSQGAVEHIGRPFRPIVPTLKKGMLFAIAYDKLFAYANPPASPCTCSVSIGNSLDECYEIGDNITVIPKVITSPSCSCDATGPFGPVQSCLFGSVQLYNSTGDLVYTTDYVYGGLPVDIPTSSLDPGEYTIVVTGNFSDISSGTVSCSSYTSASFTVNRTCGPSPGPVPIPITNCTVINSPGEYYLANDITVTGTLSGLAPPSTLVADTTTPHLYRFMSHYPNPVFCCILVNTSDVSIDMNGKHLVADGLALSSMLYESGGICGRHVSDVELYNGSVSEFDRGVVFVHGSNISVYNMSIEGSDDLAYGLEVPGGGDCKTTAVSITDVTDALLKDLRTVKYRAGLQIVSSSNVTVHNTTHVTDTYGMELGCSLLGNRPNRDVLVNSSVFSDCMSGIHVASANNVSITESLFDRDRAMGIELYTASSNISITDNVFYKVNVDSPDVTADYGAIVFRYINNLTGKTIIKNNLFLNNSRAIYFESGWNRNKQYHEILVSDNNITRSSVAGIELRSLNYVNSIRFEDNNISNNERGVWLHPPIPAGAGYPRVKYISFGTFNTTGWTGVLFVVNITDPSNPVGNAELVLPSCSSSPLGLRLESFYSNKYGIVDLSRADSCYPPGRVELPVFVQGCQPRSGISPNVKVNLKVLDENFRRVTRNTTTYTSYSLRTRSSVNISLTSEGRYYVIGSVDCEYPTMPTLNERYDFFPFTFVVSNSCPSPRFAFSVYPMYSNMNTTLPCLWMDSNISDFGFVIRVNGSVPSSYIWRGVNVDVKPVPIRSYMRYGGVSRTVDVSGYRYNLSFNGDYVCFNTVADVQDDVMYAPEPGVRGVTVFTDVTCSPSKSQSSTVSSVCSYTCPSHSPPCVCDLDITGVEPTSATTTGVTNDTNITVYYELEYSGSCPSYSCDSIGYIVSGPVGSSSPIIILNSSSPSMPGPISSGCDASSGLVTGNFTFAFKCGHPAGNYTVTVFGPSGCGRDTAHVNYTGCSVCAHLNENCDTVPC
ncbi:right-handed parallel beta-helix repeat-containing protein, partial [Candidatus Micrarchaeota archaeon]|nr:right-handed parallel beta-helix repeat-containing protein [Candidatus Micrarchaeota archaeon]